MPDAHPAALEVCPSAGMATAYEPETRKYFLFLSPCKRWSCPVCGPRRKHDLATRIKAAKPQRFLTLTVRRPGSKPDDPTGHDLDPPETIDPREAFDKTRRKCSELFRHFRKKGLPQEYVRVLEETKRGWPHYHFLMRGPKPWPQAEVSSVWKRLTGSYIVDIQFIGNDGRSTSYVTKYLQKADSVSFTTRRVTASRKFFPPKRERTPGRALELWKFYKHAEAAGKLREWMTAETIQRTESAFVFTIEQRQEGDELPEAVQKWLDDQEETAE